VQAFPCRDTTGRNAFPVCYREEQGR